MLENSKSSEATKGIGPLKPAPAHSGFSFYDGLDVCLRRGIHRLTISDHSPTKNKGRIPKDPPFANKKG
jgi:hypothetical protein